MNCQIFLFFTCTAFASLSFVEMIAFVFAIINGNSLYYCFLKHSLGFKTCDAHFEKLSDVLINVFNEDHGKNNYEIDDETYHHTGVNLDFKPHLGITYNNSRWYAGTTAVCYENHNNAHDYHLRNTYGSVNHFADFYFGKRK